jgi:hypothetical protein
MGRRNFLKIAPENSKKNASPPRAPGIEKTKNKNK